MNAITEARESTQPVNTRTGGSTFKNPPGQKAWELIDRAGCRGLRIGGAQVSELHCNFLIAHPGATAADVESLGEEVRAARAVETTSGVDAATGRSGGSDEPQQDAIRARAISLARPATGQGESSA